MAERFSACWVPGRDDEYSPCFVDVFAPLANSSLGIESDYNAGDGIHLNDAGHQVIFEAVRGVVTPYVCSMTECR
jgi:lysophospholipase L1-like esterase